MREEFAAYGLPVWCMWLTGAVKIALAIGLIVGLWFPRLVLPCGVGMALLMAGAIALHVKVGDRLIRALPAFVMLVLSILAITL